MSSTARGVLYPCFKDKVVFITGASKGIGEATALEFAKDGAKLALNGRDVPALDNVVKQCVHLGLPKENVITLVGDITDETAVKKFIEETVGKFGGLDVVVNNAGFGLPPYDNKAMDAALDVMLDINVKAVWNVIRYSRPDLVKSKGNIVNVSSIAGYRHTKHPGYSISKCAMVHLAKTLVADLAEDGVRINTIVPGLTKTSFHKTQLNLKDEEVDKIYERGADMTALGRAAAAQEVASAIQFLASSGASYITGGELLIDGGTLNIPVTRITAK